tara:strand:- start:325 stop:603 length:279 start_codon:yes stop_codon:yes gene_type:complete
MKKIVGTFFYILAGITGLGAGIYGTYLSFQMVFSIFPDWFAYLSFIFFPVVYAIAPFYAGFALGDWTLFVVSYLAMVPVIILGWLGSVISGE